MNDRYRNWWPSDLGPIRPISRKAIEEQVLEDLEEAKSEFEKLQILDSYFVYAQRVYRVREINNFSDQAGSIAIRLARIFLSNLMPEITPPYRPAKAVEKKEDIEPKCEFKWKDDSLVLECETEEDRDKAKDILNKGEVIIKVKPKDEGQKKTK